MFQKCGKVLCKFHTKFKTYDNWIDGTAFRIGSFVPCVSYHRPIQSACNVSMRFVCGICTQYIPYEARFSWLSLPNVNQIPHKNQIGLVSGKNALYIH